MGFMSAEETRTNSTGGTNNGTGLLLVFFPDHNSRKTSLSVDTPPLPASASSSSSSSPATIRRSRSSGLLLSKAQSTISVCALLFFLTLFLFTLSTFEPSSATSPSRTHRRFLFKRDFGAGIRETHVPNFALQGMGTLFLRGTKAMHDLVVTHVAADARENDLRIFLRLLHRSGVTSRSDVVFLFSSASSASRFDGVIREENDSFLRLLDVHRFWNSTNQVDQVLGFDVTRFVKNHGSKEMAEPLWGKKSFSHRVGNESSTVNETETESSAPAHGSVVGFDANELDPENSLSGFLDHVPLSLRRWACYPMLLGRVRHNFKHVMLADAKSSLFIGYPFTRVRNRSPDSVLVFTKQHSGKKNSDRTQPNSVVNPAVLLGGAKGIRRLSNAMPTEIVRAAIQHKKRNSVSDSAVLSHFVGNMHITKNFQVIASNESIVETSSLAELRTRNSKNYDIIQRCNDNNHFDFNAVIMKHLCSFEFDSFVYRDC